MYKLFSFVLATAFLVLIVSCSDDNPTEPEKKLTISSISPDSAAIGDIVTIIGTNFGTACDTNIVAFSGVNAIDYTSWSNSEIKVKVPYWAKSGKLWVIVNGIKSNEVDFTVLFPNEVSIGTKGWMTKNLDVATYRNGDSILYCKTKESWVEAGKKCVGAWCYYQNSDSIGKIYGKMYNWYAVIDSRGLAPYGWHIPSDKEWMMLELGLGMNQTSIEYSGSYRGTDQGSQLAGRADLWFNGLLKNNPNFGVSGFLAIPCGGCTDDGYFADIGSGCKWWTTTDFAADFAITRQLIYNKSTIWKSGVHKKSGISVRCVRD